jgi:hypothetical protein
MQGYLWSLNLVSTGCEWADEAPANALSVVLECPMQVCYAVLRCLYCYCTIALHRVYAVWTN